MYVIADFGRRELEERRFSEFPKDKGAGGWENRVSSHALEINRV